MKDDLGGDVHRSSLEAYRAIMKPPSRTPIYLLVAALLGLVAYGIASVRDMVFARTCAQTNDVWTGDRCEQRQLPEPPIQQFRIELPSIGPDDDVPAPPNPPPASSGLPG